MTLAITNVSTAVAKAAISESVDNVKGLCISGNINEWALHKPASYGTDKDAWTIDEDSETGYETPFGISADAYGHRLGDFRGYNHDAREPRYFSGNLLSEYKRYKQPGPVSVDIYNTLSEMPPTLNNDGFDPNFIRKIEDITEEWLIAVKFYLDGTPQSSGQNIIEWQTGSIGQTINPGEGVYALTSRYWTRQTSDAHDWVERNEIEGGGVTLTVTETDPEFHISSISSDDDPIEFFGPPLSCIVKTPTVDFTVVNDESYTINYTFWWGLGDKSGTIAISNTSLQTKDYSVIISSTQMCEPEEIFQMRISNSIGEIIFNGSFTFTVTNLT